MFRYYSGYATILFLLVLFASSCKSPGNISARSRVGIITYDQYAIKPDLVNPSDTTFFVVTKQDSFDEKFILTGNIQKPSPIFYGQTLVGISLPGRAPSKIDSAAISGAIMNIYASTCDRERPDCPDNGLALATTPKSTSVKNVQFFINGSMVKREKVKY